MQPLMLDSYPAVGRHAANSRQRMRIMGRELGVKAGRGIDQSTGTNEIGKVGRRFGGKDRIVRTTRNLRPLYLAIPLSQ